MSERETEREREREDLETMQAGPGRETIVRCGARMCVCETEREREREREGERERGPRDDAGRAGHREDIEVEERHRAEHTLSSVSRKSINHEAKVNSTLNTKPQP